jgi:hypothetical protein
LNASETPPCCESGSRHAFKCKVAKRVGSFTNCSTTVLLVTAEHRFEFPNFAFQVFIPRDVTLHALFLLRSRCVTMRLSCTGTVGVLAIDIGMDENQAAALHFGKEPSFPCRYGQIR